MAVGFSENGRWLAAGSGGPSSHVWIWDTTTWERIDDFDAKLGRKTWSICFCDSDRKLAVAGQTGLRLLNVTSDPEFSIEEVSDLALLTNIRVSHLAPDKQTLYWWQFKRNQEIPNGLYSFSFADAALQKGKLIEACNPDMFGLAVHPQGGVLYSVFGQDREQIKRRSPRGQVLESKIARRAEYMALHSQKPWAAMALNKDLGGFEIRNRETGKSIFKFPARGSIVWYLAAHPTKNQLAVARSGGSVELWNLDEVQAELTDLGL